MTNHVLRTHDRLPPLPSDIEIAHAARLRPIVEVAASIGIAPEELELFGRAKAKVHATSVMERLADQPDAPLVLVTAMTATKFGEGKTVTAIGLAQSMWRLGRKAVVALRQPSLGPVFGIKGGAAGGGRAQVVPMEDINLHFTGDFHAVTSAHNLLAACVDNTVHFDNPLGIERITWRRVIDLCDRQLREIEAGRGGKGNGWPHETGFDITASSEVMACLALAESLEDLEERLGRMVVGWRADDTPVRATEIGCVGAMMALLRDAFHPNIVQTLEGTPALIHAGPFANIAHGCNSVVATRLAMKLGDIAITEAGFAADLGAEKFLHIKCRQTGMRPAAAVVVVSCRALRAHGVEEGGDWAKPDLTALRVGLENVRVHHDNLRVFGLPVIIAANRFADDPLEELDAVRAFADELGAGFAVSEVAALGGEGGDELAAEVLRMIGEREEAADHGTNGHGQAASGNGARKGASPPEPRWRYALDAPIREKIEAIARSIYRADGVDLSAEAESAISRLELAGFGELPICVAKTQLSLSDDAKLRGAPTGWRLRVRDVKVSAGAGFLVVLAGKVLLMPGMPAHGVVERIHLDEHGEIEGIG
jgi:formate--tetrahydrofolate ligase